MTPSELHQTILRTLTQVRDIRNEHGRARANLDVAVYGNTNADDEMIGEMARNTAQALIGLVDFNTTDGGMCPLCGAEWIPTTTKGPGT